MLLQFDKTLLKLNASLPVSFRLFRTVQTVDKKQDDWAKMSRNAGESCGENADDDGFLK